MPPETPPVLPTPEPPSPAKGWTRAQWQILIIGIMLMLPILLFMIIIFVLAFRK